MEKIAQNDIKLQQKSHIFTAATRAFRKHGVLKTKLDEISAEAELPVAEVAALYPSSEDILTEILALDANRFSEHINLLISRDGLAWLAHIDDSEAGIWLEHPESSAFDRFLIHPDFDLGTSNLMSLSSHPDWRAEFIAAETEIIHQVADQLSLGKREGWICADISCTGTASLLYVLFSGLYMTREMDIPFDGRSFAEAIARFCRTLTPSGILGLTPLQAHQ